MRQKSLESVQKTFRLKLGKTGYFTEILASAHRLEKLVYLAARLHLYPMTCLLRACSLHWMLGRRRIPSRLCIGMNSSLTGMQAHAWVQVLGQAIGEPEDIETRFKILEPSNLAV
jgi:hypothetical protein